MLFRSYEDSLEVKPADWWSENASEDGYCVQFEEGPYAWALGYVTKVPGVWVEPYNSFVLMVYPND